MSDQNETPSKRNEPLHNNNNAATKKLMQDLQPGDHIYIWKCAYLYQHHAIVVSTDEGEGTISVAEFYPGSQHSDSANTIQIASLNAFCRNARIRKVQYSASLPSRILFRSGTVTSTPRDHAELVLARLHYILSNQHLLPRFHALSANDECICVWISTGIYCTLQVCSQLYFFSVGQAKSAVVTSGVVAHMTVTVPMAGMWGWMGYTTSVPLTTAQPVVIPLLVGYGLVSIVPLEMLRRFKKKWKALEDDLNRGFWESASVDIVDKFWISKHIDVVMKFFEGEEEVPKRRQEEVRKKLSSEVGSSSEATTSTLLEEEEPEKVPEKKVTEKKKIAPEIIQV